MEFRIIILFILLSLNASCQRKILGLKRPNEVFFLVIGGESNAPGYGQNFFLSSAEKEPRYTKIWNHSVSTIQQLDIPLNQVSTFDTTHGFELQVANLIDSNSFGQFNPYITKTGEGSTLVADWQPGEELYIRMLERIDASIQYILTEHGEVTTFWLLWTQGINDMFASVPAATWKAATIVIFDALKDRYPTLNIAQTKFNQPSYTGYNTVIQEIDDELNYVWSIPATDAGLRSDNTHWDWEGLKTIGRRVVQTIQAND